MATTMVTAMEATVATAATASCEACAFMGGRTAQLPSSPVKPHRFFYDSKSSGW